MTNDSACDSRCHRDWIYGPCRHEPHSFHDKEIVWIAPECHTQNMPPYGPYRIKELGRDGFYNLEYIGDNPRERGRDPRARGNILTRIPQFGKYVCFACKKRIVREREWVKDYPIYCVECRCVALKESEVGSAQWYEGVGLGYVGSSED